jgi:hypothetical protein
MLVIFTGKGLAMVTRNTLWLLMFSVMAPGLAQDLKLDYQRNENNQKVTIQYEKYYHGSVTLRLSFNQLSNSLSPMEMIKVLNRSRGSVTTLQPVDSEKPIGFGYRYSYIKGALLDEAVQNVAYCLPFPAGTKVKVLKAYNIDERYLGSELPENWTAYRMLPSNPDTIVAARRGVVLSVEQSYPIIDSLVYTSRHNVITVEHPDGTQATYRGFAQDEVWVDPGDNIYPGQPLGSIRSASGKIGAFFFKVYYISKIDFDFKGQETLQNRKVTYSYLEPLFQHNEGAETLKDGATYQTILNDALISQEMSRREWKRYRKSQ